MASTFQTKRPMLSQPIEPPAELVADIRTRLGRVCESYTADEFNELVRQIARIRTKYDALRADAFFDSARILGARRVSDGAPPRNAQSGSVS